MASKLAKRMIEKLGDISHMLDPKAILRAEKKLSFSGCSSVLYISPRCQSYSIFIFKGYGSITIWYVDRPISKTPRYYSMGSIAFRQELNTLQGKKYLISYDIERCNYNMGLSSRRYITTCLVRLFILPVWFLNENLPDGVIDCIQDTPDLYRIRSSDAVTQDLFYIKENN